MDQAQSLRRMAARRKSARGAANPLRTIAVTSGKGGVGKTNLVVNLAVWLSKMGRKVLIMDADLGLANVDVVLGISPEYTMRDVVQGQKRLSEVVVDVAEGIQLLPGSSGVSELASLGSDEKLVILEELDSFTTDADTVLIDTAAGISDLVLYFNIAAQDRVVVCTNEPTSLTDAYALIKVLYTKHQERSFKLVVNQVRGQAEAKEVYGNLSAVIRRFLKEVSLDYLGHIPRDQAVPNAVKQQKPLASLYPDSQAAQSIKRLAHGLLESPAGESGGNIKFFWRRLVNMA